MVAFQGPGPAGGHTHRCLQDFQIRPIIFYCEIPNPSTHRLFHKTTSPAPFFLLLPSYFWCFCLVYFSLLKNSFHYDFVCPLNSPVFPFPELSAGCRLYESPLVAGQSQTSLVSTLAVHPQLAFLTDSATITSRRPLVHLSIACGYVAVPPPAFPAFVH